MIVNRYIELLLFHRIFLMSKLFKFPLDQKKFKTKGELYNHIETHYPNLINDDMPPSRLYFNLKYGKTEGKSVISGKPTKWNNITERYERFVDDSEREQYRKMFKERMMQKYGKVHILDDPEQQKKMLSNRKISIDYKWNDGSISIVNSQYEYDFLNFIESSYQFNKDCFTEPPTIYYKLPNGNTSFYLPDFYIPSLNLIIEVKGTNNHYQTRDGYKEDIKAAATRKEGFEFLQLTDRMYISFNTFFKKHVLDN